jgi:Fic family protein
LVGTGEARYAAFVPNPLPPEIAYDAALSRVLSDADRALGELNGLGRMLPNPDLLINPFMHKEAVLSSKIEGTQATITDVYAMEAGHRGTPRIPEDVQEVLNYVGAMRYGLERLDTLPLSLRFMRELHERLMQHVRGAEKGPGEFRHSQNWIGPPGCLLRDATYVPPPPAEMMEVLADFERYLHTEDDRDPPLVRLALVHGQFELIHPFLDGNGRIGRLLVSLLLVHWQLLSHPLLYLSAYFERERHAYYDSLLALSQRGAWLDWVHFFLRGVRDQSRDAAQRAKRLQDLQQVWRARVTLARSSALTLRLIDSLFESPIVTIPRAQQHLGVTYPAAKLNVQKLVDARILRPFGQGSYGKAFIASEILEAIEK